MYKISNNSLNILYLCIPIPAFTWISWRRGGSFLFEETPSAPFPRKSLMKLFHVWTEQDSLLPPCSPLFQWALGCGVLKQCQHGESEDKAGHTWVTTWQSLVNVSLKFFVILGGGLRAHTQRNAWAINWGWLESLPALLLTWCSWVGWKTQLWRRPLRLYALSTEKGTRAASNCSHP